jgi:hypothetical protein
MKSLLFPIQTFSKLRFSILYEKQRKMRNKSGYHFSKDEVRQAYFRKVVDFINLFYENELG